MPEYPGLGLPLRYNPQGAFNFYPIGAHHDCYGATSFVLPVRELAMMSILESLTDKPDWHKKVFDLAIVSKWCQEALAIPDEKWIELAWRWKDGRIVYDDEDPLYLGDEDHKLEGIIDNETFDFVCYVTFDILSWAH